MVIRACKYTAVKIKGNQTFELTVGRNWSGNSSYLFIAVEEYFFEWKDSINLLDLS